ncbi:hypothetical protein [Paenibacillus aceris]|uniref:Uncharacterized protein n=1 Tax=Paenibacillus aceris TaxID=869555 RepID=A0ABS4I8C0_9BACL|nr:hypothetical protein [Paenibacillus aceris]MBP1967158.1 hypothetical protein [Paenibacillus aceris]NHW35556.1 hypothetical protein [Paenibacillus aceris]
MDIPIIFLYGKEMLIGYLPVLILFLQFALNVNVIPFVLLAVILGVIGGASKTLDITIYSLTQPDMSTPSSAKQTPLFHTELGSLF